MTRPVCCVVVGLGTRGARPRLLQPVHQGVHEHLLDGLASLIVTTGLTLCREGSKCAILFNVCNIVRCVYNIVQVTWASQQVIIFLWIEEVARVGARTHINLDVGILCGGLAPLLDGLKIGGQGARYQLTEKLVEELAQHCRI
jgi:hypothetical protein